MLQCWTRSEPRSSSGIIWRSWSNSSAEQRALRKESHARVGTLTNALTEIERRLAQNYEALEGGTMSVDDLAPRIRGLREEQKKLAASIRESKSPSGKASDVPSVEDIVRALENFGDVLATDSQGERKEFIRGFVTQVVKSEDQALIRYWLTDGRPAPQKEVLDTDLFGGAGGIRTRYLLLAKQALSQVSYSPVCLSATL
jgi:site-specific DNA recombinase